MAIRIVTLQEVSPMESVASEYGEVCEMVIGRAKADYRCDISGEKIPKGTVCAVAVILPSKKHVNYEHQKGMLEKYVTVR